MQISRLITGAGLFALSACGGGADSGNIDVAQACKANTNMNAGICECIGKKAKQELTRKGQAFIVHSLAKEHEKAYALTRTMEHRDAAEAGVFLMSASTECASD